MPCSWAMRRAEPPTTCTGSLTVLSDMSSVLVVSYTTRPGTCMQVSINTADPRPIYLQIMDEIRRALVLGTLKPGDSLPSIRQLASELRVNPNTVAQAYSELEREGVAYVQRGRGTFISPDVEPGREERRALARDVAERALIDAHRNGLSAEELLSAIRAVAAGQDQDESAKAGAPE